MLSRAFDEHYEPAHRQSAADGSSNMRDLKFRRGWLRTEFYGCAGAPAYYATALNGKAREPEWHDDFPN